MKIFSAKQIQYLDQFTIEHEPITSIDLMERAANAFVDGFEKDIEKDNSIHIFCGAGNNGGDGLAIGRLLFLKGHNIKIYLLPCTKNYTEDLLINLERVEKLSIPIITVRSLDGLAIALQEGIIVDAIFGTGLSRPIEGLALQVITLLNKTGLPIISVDMPSGVFADKPTIGKAIQAKMVYSFQFPKLAFMMAANSSYIKDFKILDIGLLKPGSTSLTTNYEFFTKKTAIDLFNERDKFSHKGSHGHLLLIAGSKGKAGAAILAARAALRSGVGLLSLFVPNEILPILQESVPEAMCLVKSETQLLSDLKEHQIYKSIAIGPGIGTEDNTAIFFTSLLSSYKTPLVIDADGLNIISKNKSLLLNLPKESILTPHPGEFKRLVGSWKNDFEKLHLQIELSKKYELVIVLKGAHTSISSPDGKVTFNSTGNNGMATAGSGDTLTGIIAGFVTQGYKSIHAAQLGVFLHGLAGDLALKNQHLNSLIASDITENLGKAFKAIEK